MDQAVNMDQVEDWTPASVMFNLLKLGVSHVMFNLQGTQGVKRAKACKRSPKSKRNEIKSVFFWKSTNPLNCCWEQANSSGT